MSTLKTATNKILAVFNPSTPYDPPISATLLPSTALENRNSDDEGGFVTAEYAVGIIAAVAFAGVLLAVVKSGAIRTALTQIVQSALSV
ncbi:MAG: DUF4244 domain-containing protein [Actinomycetaceae bacterium]|nr:DUF4244 domain-containing protein [Actinomycetaceae bacterium]